MLILTGCGGLRGANEAGTKNQPTESPQVATQGPVVTPDSEPTPPPASIVLPACDSMNPVAQQEYLDYGPELFAAPAGPADRAVFEQIFGTVFTDQASLSAQLTANSAVQEQGCWWPVHMQGSVTQYAFEVPQEGQASLLAALKSRADVTELFMGAATTFSFASDPDPMGGTISVTHLFLGDVWSVVLNFAGDGNYAQSALDALLKANQPLAQGEGTGEQNEASENTEKPAACAVRNGLDVLAYEAIGIPGGPWDSSGKYSDVSGYDACADLSWIVLRPQECCTRFSVSPVLLFYKGDFYGTTTEEHYALGAPVRRIADDAVSLTYTWPVPGALKSDAPPTATSTFTFSQDTGLIERSGDLPPNH